MTEPIRYNTFCDHLGHHYPFEGVDFRENPGAAVGYANAYAVDLMRAVDRILSQEPKADPVPRHREPTPRRNDPCPCGSGRRFKSCCMRKAKE